MLTVCHRQAVDWWSVGVLTYELLTGASPFTVEGEKNTQQEISKRILKSEAPMPGFLSDDVKDFILKLLVKDPRKRLGGGISDAEDVKTHRFFRTVNWDDLLQKNIPAPFVPKIRGDTDVSNFSEEFTNMNPVDSPGIIPPNVEKVFKGYSFVAPSVLFSENCVSDDIFKPSPDKRPSVSNLVGMRLKNSAFFQKYRLDLKEKILGDGSFSVCRRCVKLGTEEEFAVKIISRRVDAVREIRLLEICQGHPGVVRLVEVLQDECHTYVVMELLRGGELFRRIRQKKRFTEREAASIMGQLVSVVSYMHSLGVVHRDLKPENLLFDSEAEAGAQIKVVDFGFARLKPELDSGMLTPCFTLQYAAPEILELASRTTQEGYSESCDLWSLGVILFAMLSGRSPFYSKTRTDSASHVMRRIKEGDFRLEGEAWRYVSAPAKQLTKGLLTVDPRKRVSMEQLRSSSWLGGPGATLHCGSLLTTSVLTTEPLERCLKQTYDAFHNVTREGFRLTPVSSASSKLAKRRQLKQSLSSDTTTSDRSSLGSKGSSSSSASVTLTPTKNWAEAAASAASSSSATLSRAKDSGVEIFSLKAGQVHPYLAQPPASLLTPLTVATGPSSYSVSSQSVASALSHHYIQSLSSAAATATAAPPPFSPYHPGPADTVSLSLIHSNLNVINSSSVIARVGVAHSPAPPPATPPSQSATGPLTRSRKRRLFDTGDSASSRDNTFGSTKVHRAGTIVIE